MAYLAAMTDGAFTAKDFRTWGGTVCAAVTLGEMKADTKKMIRKNEVAATKTVAAILGNRPATCRKYYIDPLVFDAYEHGRLEKMMRFGRARAGGLKPAERATLRLLSS